LDELALDMSQAEEQQRRASFQKHQEVSDSYACLGGTFLLTSSGFVVWCAESHVRRKGLRSFLARHQGLLATNKWYQRWAALSNEHMWILPENG